MLAQKYAAIFVLASMLSFLEFGNCNERPEEKDMVKDSFAAMKAMYENEDKSARINVILKQKFKDGKDPTDIDMIIKKEGTPEKLKELDDMKIYLTSRITMDQCSAFTMAETDTDITSLVGKFSESVDEPVSGTPVAGADIPGDSSSRRRRDVPAMATTAVETPEDANMTVTVRNAGNVFDRLDNLIVFVNGDTKVCRELMMEETSGFMKLTMKFAATTDFDRNKLVKILLEKTGMPKGSVQAKLDGSADGCKMVDLYFNSDFKNDTSLRKLYRLLQDDSCLGYFSPTSTCKTDLMSQFVGKFMVDRFADKDFCKKNTKDDNNDPPKSSGCSSSCVSQRLMQTYQKSLDDYNRRMKEYASKYGSSCGRTERDDDGRNEERNFDGRDEYDNYGRRQGVVDQARDRDGDGRCECGSSDENERYFSYLSQYVGMGPREEIREKVEELREVMNGRTGGQVDANKVKMLSEKISELQMDAKVRARMTRFAICLMSKAGNRSFEYLKMAKQRINEAEDKDEEGKKILKEKILSAMKEKFGKMAEKDYGKMKKNVSRSEMKKQIATKLQMMLNVNTECSSEEERMRVTLVLWGLKTDAPDFLNPLMEKLDIAEIKQFFEKDMFGDDFEQLATTMFSLIYVPFSVQDNATFLDRVEKFQEIISKNADKILEKGMSIMEEVPVEKLMAFSIMLMSGEDMKTGCPIKKLAEEVMKERDAPAPCDRDRQRRDFRRDDEYERYGFPAYQRIGQGGRQQTFGPRFNQDSAYSREYANGQGDRRFRPGF